MTIKLGSLFSGIGGFELGLERAIPTLKTVWQCEQDTFCQSILRKHWPEAIIYDDVRDINNEMENIDILCGGFPCQDISYAGRRKGINENTRSGLWWEMHRITSIFRPRVIILENVAAITSMGGPDVVRSLVEIGYDTEWTVIRASDFGAPHKRARWFCVGYPSGFTDRKWTTTHPHSHRVRTHNTVSTGGAPSDVYDTEGATHPHSIRPLQVPHRWSSHETETFTYWSQNVPKPPLCGMDDGISRGMDRTIRAVNKKRLKALGNAIVPQCSQWIGEQVLKSGLLDDLLMGEPCGS